MLTDWALTAFFFLGSQTVGAMIRAAPSFSDEQNSILESCVSPLTPKAFSHSIKLSSEANQIDLKCQRANLPVAFQDVGPCLNLCALFQSRDGRRMEADNYADKKRVLVDRLLRFWQCLRSPSLDMLIFKLFRLQLAHLCHSLSETITSTILKPTSQKENAVNGQMG